MNRESKITAGGPGFEPDAPPIGDMTRLVGGKTGWPPGLLQDDSKGLSRWLASKPDAREVVRKSASTESMPDYTATAPIRQDGEP